MEFKIGNKVRCIDITYRYCFKPIIGKYYIISSIFSSKVIGVSGHGLNNINLYNRDFKIVPFKEGTLVERKVFL